jgi:hypothetical protein
VASCEWVGRDDEIFHSQSGYDMCQMEITFIFKTPSLYKLQYDPLI